MQLYENSVCLVLDINEALLFFFSKMDEDQISTCNMRKIFNMHIMKGGFKKHKDQPSAIFEICQGTIEKNSFIY